MTTRYEVSCAGCGYRFGYVDHPTEQADDRPCPECKETEKRVNIFVGDVRWPREGRFAEPEVEDEKPDY